MPTPQFFKGDDLEQRFYQSMKPISETLEGQKADFFNGAYECFALGDLLWVNNLSPLARAIRQDIFRQAFATIFDSFISAGSFESYLSVFRNIFGDDVEVEFTVPAAGKLNIDIVATGLELSPILVREIVENAYVFYDLVDDEDDNIVLQTIKGFESEYELEQMLFEMVPDGIYTQITLTVGE